MTIFTDAFVKLGAALGIDVLKLAEERYLYHARKYNFRNRIQLNYPTGRSNVPEKPERVLQFYNDLKTRPSQTTLDEMTAHAVALTKGLKESQSVKAIAQWVDTVAVYEEDPIRWGKPEFWSSPFDLWAQWKLEGKMVDDCDGIAVIIHALCKMVGVEIVFIRAGMAKWGNNEEGHANIVYYPADGTTPFYVEGTFLPALNYARWGSYKFPVSSMYPDTWFLFDENATYSTGSEIDILEP